ncbi:hypothetical protein ARMGADRAFT_1084376 [Armillaria gallica]|uniref:Uncharacterized protein n=1 Tax=Armillaria gallica TaxID=47427 RepID=A0A2H3D0L3_ARMGA|nr:hypothetical protein ARMGADRAFT_1084376 [Armillaria gallica]
MARDETLRIELLKQNHEKECERLKDELAQLRAVASKGEAEIKCKNKAIAATVQDMEIVVQDQKHSLEARSADIEAQVLEYDHLCGENVALKEQLHEAQQKSASELATFQKQIEICKQYQQQQQKEIQRLRHQSIAEKEDLKTQFREALNYGINKYRSEALKRFTNVRNVEDKRESLETKLEHTNTRLSNLEITPRSKSPWEKASKRQSSPSKGVKQLYEDDLEHKQGNPGPNLEARTSLTSQESAQFVFGVKQKPSSFEFIHEAPTDVFAQHSRASMSTWDLP